MRYETTRWQLQNNAITQFLKLKASELGNPVYQVKNRDRIMFVSDISYFIF